MDGWLWVLVAVFLHFVARAVGGLVARFADRCFTSGAAWQIEKFRMTLEIGATFTMRVKL